MSDTSQKPHFAPHRKSRLGCKICKARKIKCDEQRPVCGNCHRRYPDPSNYCAFDQIPQDSTLAHSQSSVKSSRDSSSRSSPDLEPSIRFTSARTMELRLFHHFSTKTCLKMPASETAAGLRMWKTVVPRLAMQFQYVYFGILAVAAVHLLQTADESVALRTVACQYMEEAVSLYRKDVGEISHENAEARYITAVLLAMHAKIRARYEGGTRIPFVPPVTYFVLQIGARDLWFMDSYCGIEFKEWILCYKQMHLPQYPSPQPCLEQYLLEDFQADPLLAFLGSTTNIELERKIVYNHTMTYLELIKDCIRSGESADWIRQRLSIAPCEFGNEFVSLMRSDDSIAMLILARFFSLFTFVDQVWWLEGTAVHELNGLASLIPEEWQWGMEWPLRILNNSSKHVG